MANEEATILSREIGLIVDVIRRVCYKKKIYKKMRFSFRCAGLGREEK